jgi:hypothetical protein
MRKSGSTTTWEVFDVDFEEVGLELEWGLFYRCPGVESIQHIQKTQMDKDSSWGYAVLHKEHGVSLGNAFLGCAVETTSPQARVMLLLQQQRIPFPSPAQFLEPP